MIVKVSETKTDPIETENCLCLHNLIINNEALMNHVIYSENRAAWHRWVGDRLFNF